MGKWLGVSRKRKMYDERIPLTTDTSGGTAGRTISLLSRYMTTTLLIFMFMCCCVDCGVQKVKYKWSSADVIQSEDV
jgi:hypothetical protein